MHVGRDRTRKSDKVHVVTGRVVWDKGAPEDVKRFEIIKLHNPRQRWQGDYAIVDVLGNKVGNLDHVTQKHYVASDGTQFERDYTTPSRYSIVRRSQIEKSD